MVSSDDLLCLDFEFPDVLSYWEKEFKEKYHKDPFFFRSILLGTISKRELSPSFKQHLIFRYFHGFFDSVSACFVIGDISIPTLCQLADECVGVPFRKSLAKQSEFYWPSRVKEAGFFSLLSAQTLDFSTADVLMREDILGTRFTKHKSFGRVYMVGGSVSFLVNDDFPVDEAIWDGFNMSVLKPYGLETMAVGNLNFVPHTWEPMCASRANEFTHGMLILFGGEEFRVHHSPRVTISAEDDLVPSHRRGLWEVSLSDVEDDTKSEFDYIRPRPGASFLSVSKARSFLKSCARLSDITIPEISPISVSYVTTGPFNGSFGQEGTNIWFDSGWRVAGTECVAAPHVPRKDEVVPDNVYRVGDTYHHVRGNTEVVSPTFCKVMKPTVTGSKVCIFDCSGAVYLFKDKGKQLDFVGGGVKPDEDSYACAVREVWEELGVAISDLKLLGVSSMVEDRIDFHTFLYLAPLMGPLLKVASLLVPVQNYDFAGLDCVPWMLRLMTSVSRRVPETKKLMEFYMTLANRREAAREVLFSSVPRSSLINYRALRPYRLKQKQQDLYVPPHARGRKN